MRPYALAICLILLPVILLAATIHVPADQPTIRLGIEVADEGDTILIACGTYTWTSEGADSSTEGSLFHLRKGLAFFSESQSPDCVSIDVEGQGGAFVADSLGGASDVVLDGLSILGGGGDHLAIGAFVGSSFEVRNCSISGWSTAFSAYQGSASFYDCEIADNGEVFHLYTGGSYADNCLFENNQRFSWGYHGGPSLISCTVIGTEEVFRVFDGYIYAENCIFWDIDEFYIEGIPEFPSPPNVTCSDIQGGYEEGDESNIDEDPLFCDPWGGDYSISDQSPCLPGGNDCGVLMGAYEAGCGLLGGLIMIEVEPGEVGMASWTLIGPDESVLTGAGDDSLEYMPSGMYDIEWIDIDGWVTPAADSSFLANGDTVEFVGQYLHCIVQPDASGLFPTIQSAIDSFPMCHGDTIFLANGVFTGPGNRDMDFQGKSLVLRSLSGSPDSCIIDCQGTESEPHRGFLFQSGETSEATIDGITIMGGYTDEGGAIKCENGSSPTIRNCILRDNYADTGAAAHCSSASDPLFEYTLIHSNVAITGGAIWAESSSPVFTNCTISYNQGAPSGVGFLISSSSSFENCILSHSIDGASFYCIDSNPILSCTNVVWNEGGDWVGCIADQQNQNGNFSNTPAFCDPENGDFRLQPGSPCLPEHNDCGVLVGALGEGDCAPTGAEEVPVSDRVLLSAYPNPFNPHLTVTFSLPVEIRGSIIVLDVLGRRVRLLREGQFACGVDVIRWDGKDDQGLEVSSGVYFVRLEAAEELKTKKVVLLR